MKTIEEIKQRINQMLEQLQDEIVILNKREQKDLFGINERIAKYNELIDLNNFILEE